MSPTPLSSTCAAPGVALARTLPAVRMGAGDPCWASDGAAWTWATRTPDGPATVRVRPAGADEVAAEAWGDGAAWLLDRVPGLVGALDPGPGTLPDRPELAPLLPHLEGLHLARTHRPLDAAIAAVCRRGVSAFEAARAWALMVEAFGDDAPGPGGLRLPPAPQRVAAASPYEMHVMGLETERAAEVRRLASHAARLEVGPDEDDGALLDRIRSLPGVASEVVDHVAAVALGHADALPVVDGHVLASAVRILHGAVGEAPALAELLEPYRPQRLRVVRAVEAAEAPRP